nr:hypothetical protein [Tanacetum cinerariifolium]
KELASPKQMALGKDISNPLMAGRLPKTTLPARYSLAKVRSWKLFESYGVRCITFSTTQMFLLVEKRYPLTHFTLEEMLNNVRLEVEEKSKMYLELLRLVRR